MTPSLHTAELASQFELAAGRTGGIVERSFLLAGNRILLRLAGGALPSILLPALAHHPNGGPEKPSLIVYLWEEHAAPPRAFGETTDAGGGLCFLRRDGLLAAFEPLAGTLSVLDRPASTAFFRVTDASLLPAWIGASPLHDILHWWMAGRGLTLVHGAAVGTERGGILLAGPGGSGKSTCALACLGSALKLAGEDYCFASAGERPFIHSLYSAAKLDSGSAALVPHLASDVASAPLFEGTKAVIFLFPRWAKALSRGFPLKALLVPRIVEDARPSLAPESPARALAALAPSTIFQFPGGGEETFRRLAGIARTIPCYRLAVGPDLFGLPELILSLLDGDAA